MYKSVRIMEVALARRSGIGSRFITDAYEVLYRVRRPTGSIYLDAERALIIYFNQF